jgi:acyl-CoA reductase-like NAD-dependent aldehyde dehydrogenase
MPRTHALLALDLMQVLAISNIPDGVINLVVGNKVTLAEQLAGHRSKKYLDALWRLIQNCVYPV